MIPFLVLLFTPILIQHIVIDKRYVDFEKRNKWALFTFFAILTILVALRHESVGNDTRNYIMYFKHYVNLKWDNLLTQDLEVGFSYFNKIVSMFTKEAQVFFIIIVIFTVAPIYNTYKRLCVDPGLTILLFCLMSTFVLMFSGIRQMLAVGIGFIAYEFTRQKKLIQFVLCVILAISIHTSAFMLILMYPLFHAKITKKWLWVVVPMLTILFLYNKEIFSVLGTILLRYTEFDPIIEETGAYTMIILFALFSIFAFIIPDESLLDSETIGLRNFLLLALVLQMFAPLNMLAMRMNYYYIIFIPLLLPKIIKYKSERWKQVAILGRHIMVIFFLVYFFYNAYTSESNLHVFPYHFFWEKV